MSSSSGWDRRGFVRAIAGVGVVGALAGCNSGDGDGEDGGDGGDGSDGTGGGNGTDGGSTPTESNGGNESGDGEASIGGANETISAAVEQANTIIEQMNHCGPQTDLCLESTNERLENVEDIEYVEQVEASSPDEARQEAQRLRDENDRLHESIRTKVPREINEQAPFEVIEDPDQYQTPEDFREGAEDMDIERAQVAMNDAADGMERIEQVLTTAADDLESAADEAESS